MTEIVKPKRTRFVRLVDSSFDGSWSQILCTMIEADKGFKPEARKNKIIILFERCPLPPCQEKTSQYPVHGNWGL